MTMSGAGVMISETVTDAGPAPWQIPSGRSAGNMPGTLEEPFFCHQHAALLLARHSPYGLQHCGIRSHSGYGIVLIRSLTFMVPSFHKLTMRINTRDFSSVVFVISSTKIKQTLWKVIQIVTATRSPAEKEKRRRRRGALSRLLPLFLPIF